MAVLPMIQIGKIKDNLYRNIQIIKQKRASRFPAGRPRRFVRPLSGKLRRATRDSRCKQSQALDSNGCAAMETAEAEKADAATSLTVPAIQALRSLYPKTGMAPPHRTLSVFHRTTGRAQSHTFGYLLSSDWECLHKLSAAPPMSMRTGGGRYPDPAFPGALWRHPQKPLQEQPGCRLRIAAPREAAARGKSLRAAQPILGHAPTDLFDK